MRTDIKGTSWLSDFLSKLGRFIGGAVLAAVGATSSLASILPAFGSSLATVACEFGLTIGTYGAALVGSVFNRTIYSDMERIHWNPYNSDAYAAAQFDKISFYNGVPMFRANLEKGRSMSFGFILMDTYNYDVDTVKHEFGHIPQLMFLGIARYGLCIGIPSKDEWNKKVGWPYYDAPWDAMADYFGGVTSRQHDSTIINRAWKYLILSYFVGPFIHAFYKNL